MLLTALVNLNFSEWLNAINWQQPSWDLFIVLLFLVAVFLYGFSMGRNRIIVVLLAIYLAKVIVDTLPFIPQFEQYNLGQYFVAQILIFCALFLILFFMFISSGPFHTLAQYDTGRWYQVIIFSLLHVGLMVSIIFSYLPPEVLNNFSQTIQKLFNSPLARLLWITLPIVSLALIKDKKRGAGRPPLV